jgi:hypothetical protein
VRIQDTDFYQQGFFKLVKRWDKCINVGGDHAEMYPTTAPFRPHRYLVHAVSCRWKSRETYLPTIPRIYLIMREAIVIDLHPMSMSKECGFILQKWELCL